MLFCVKLMKRIAIFAFGAVSLSNAAYAACDTLPTHADLTDALKSSVQPSGGPSNGGFDLHMWATMVNRAGEVCAVTHTGDGPGDQWPGSRVISAQKANTANAFSLPGLALATANLWAATQPGGSLFGLQFSNPVATSAAYAGNMEAFGTAQDPMTGMRVGGVNVFGGGLPVYDENGTLVGAIGVSGDSSCADHNIAWRLRDTLGLANVPSGVHPNGNDGIIYDIGGNGMSASGFGHPTCGNSEDTVAGEIGAGCAATFRAPSFGHAPASSDRAIAL